MGVHVLAVYRPKPQRNDDLEREVADHVPLLRSVGLATDRPSVALRAPDGTIVEYFEWESREALDEAHTHPEVQAMWRRFDACCDYVTLGGLVNAADLFAEFELLGSF